MQGSLMVWNPHLLSICKEYAHRIGHDIQPQPVPKALSHHFHRSPPQQDLFKAGLS